MIEDVELTDSFIKKQKKENLINEEEEKEEEKECIINNPMSKFIGKSIKQEERKTKKIESQTFSGKIKIIYIIKDYLLCFFLLNIPCPNFCYLHIPYYIFGILSLFFLLGNSIETRKCKFFFEIIVIVYTFFSVVAKTSCLFINNLFNNDLIIQIGVPIIKNKNDIFYYLTTFVPEAIILIISIFSIIITSISKKYIIFQQNKVNKKQFYNICHAIMMIDFIFIISLSCFNISIITLIYVMLININILFFCMKINKDVNILLFNFFSIIILILLIIINLGVSIFNIHQFYPENKSSLCQVIQEIGIQNLNLHFNKESILLWIGYFLSNICIILLLTTDKLINLIIENEEMKEVIIDESNKNKKPNKLNQIKEILLNIKNYLSSPSFVLHFTRSSIIVWIYFYRNYASFILFIWLCTSFLYIDISKTLIWTELIAFPSLYYTIFMIHFANIPYAYETPTDNNEKIKKEYYGLIKFKYDQRIEYSCLFLVLIFMYIFFYSLIKNKKDTFKNNKNNNNQLSSPLIKKKSNKENSFSVKKIILQIIFSNIDKLTLVSMYFVANQFVNFTHLILVFLFIFQLLSPKKFEKLCFYIMILIEIIFGIEYIIDLIKVFFKTEKKIIELFVAYNDIEIFLFLAIYCLYIQYQFINSEVYQKLSREKQEKDKYLKFDKKQQSLLKKIFHVIKDIILELYIWIIIILCFILLCAFEINILFLIKLIIYLFVLYDFLVSIQEKKNLNRFANLIFLIYCAINTLIVYFYQFSQIDTCKNLFDNFYQKIFPQFIYENFTQIGLIKYTKNLPIKFLPHFGLNFLSILFLRETKRIINFNEKNKLKRTKVIKGIKLIEQIEENENEKNEEEEEKEEIPIIKNEKKERTIVIVEKEILQKNIQYYIFQILVLFTKFYFLFLFLTVCIILTNYDISFAMTIYISIFGISFLCLYKKNINQLRKFILKKSFFLSKLIRYSQIELPSHIESNRYYRSIILKILLAFSEIYILLVYSYATFYMIQHNCNEEGIIKFYFLFNWFLY